MVFLVACTRLYNPLCPSVGRSVGRLVRHTLLFLWFYFFDLTAPSKWSGDLKYGPCPPARDFGSRVSSLVFIHLTLRIKLANAPNVVNNLVKVLILNHIKVNCTGLDIGVWMRWWVKQPLTLILPEDCIWALKWRWYIKILIFIFFIVDPHPKIFELAFGTIFSNF